MVLLGGFAFITLAPGSIIANLLPRFPKLRRGDSVPEAGNPVEHLLSYICRSEAACDRSVLRLSLPHPAGSDSICTPGNSVTKPCERIQTRLHPSASVVSLIPSSTNGASSHSVAREPISGHYFCSLSFPSSIRGCLDHSIPRDHMPGHFCGSPQCFHNPFYCAQ